MVLICLQDIKAEVLVVVKSEDSIAQIQTKIRSLEQERGSSGGTVRMALNFKAGNAVDAVYLESIEVWTANVIVVLTAAVAASSNSAATEDQSSIMVEIALNSVLDAASSRFSTPYFEKVTLL